MSNSSVVPRPALRITRSLAIVIYLVALLLPLAPVIAECQPATSTAPDPLGLAPLSGTTTGGSTTAAGRCGVDTDCPRGQQCSPGSACIPCPTRAPTPSPTTQSVEEAFKFKPVEPKINFNPTGFKFSELQVEDRGGDTLAINIPWIGQYVAAFYRIAIPFGAMLAVVMIMVGGVIWMTSGGAGRLSTAKDYIANAVIGLLLLVGSYLLLRTVSPALTSLQSLQIRVVKPLQFDEESEPESVGGIDPGVTDVLTGGNIVGKRIRVTEELIPDLQAAARDAQATGYQLSFTSGFRSLNDQRRLIARNCQNPPGSPRCNPKSDRPTTCILRDGPKSCPHTTGRAVDVWGAQNGTQCIRQEDCLRGLNACRNNPCQKAVIDAMRKQKFCNLNIEPWHFEKPFMSPGCT